MSTISSISAKAPVAGCNARLRPSSPEARPSPLRASSGGVWIVPHATTTVGARTSNRPPLASRASTPRATPRSTSTWRTSAPEITCAPAASARGTYVMPTCCLADVGQPNAHTPEPTQPLALRRRKPCDQPSASAPRRATAAFLPASSGVTSAIESAASTRAKQGSSASSVSPSKPNSRCQRSSTAGGVRKHVPELTRVVPPRPRPSGSRIGGVPSVVVWPPSR